MSDEAAILEIEDDAAFHDRWVALGLEGRSALPEEIYICGQARFDHLPLSKEISRSIERAERAQTKRGNGAADDWAFPGSSMSADPAPAHIPFPRINFDDLGIDHHVDYLLKGILERGTNATIYGPSGDGKTFFCIDMVLHIACGIPWRGRRVQQALVVYVASEAGASIARRFVAWREQRKGDAAGPTPMVVLTQGPNLMNQVDVQRLMMDLKDISEEWSMPIGLVVFDTLSRSIAGGDENISKDMTLVTAAADRIRNELGAATLFVHHSGKDQSKGQRGTSSLPAANDMIICVVERVATVEKARDGIEGGRFAFDLRIVDLGADQDGEPITTCIVIPTDSGSVQAKAKGRALSTSAQVVLDALRIAIDSHGDRMPETSALPKGVRAVRLEHWQDAYAVMRPLPKDLSTPEATKEAKKERNARRMAFGRAQNELQAARVVGTGAGFWWIA